MHSKALGKSSQISHGICRHLYRGAEATLEPTLLTHFGTSHSTTALYKGCHSAQLGSRSAGRRAARPHNSPQGGLGKTPRDDGKSGDELIHRFAKPNIALTWANTAGLSHEPRISDLSKPERRPPLSRIQPVAKQQQTSPRMRSMPRQGALGQRQEAGSTVHVPFCYGLCLNMTDSPRCRPRAQKSPLSRPHRAWPGKGRILC
jgi:hypothetical protein